MLKTYTTVQGDMWDSIAYKCYGDESGINVLMAVNETYVDTVVFLPVLCLTSRSTPNR